MSLLCSSIRLQVESRPAARERSRDLSRSLDGSMPRAPDARCWSRAFPPRSFSHRANRGYLDLKPKPELVPSPSMRLFLRSALGLVAMSVAGVRGDFNNCLGLDMSQLRDDCTTLYSACEVGVAKLNKQLALSTTNALHPVCIISASESKTPDTDNTLFALLVQAAPCADSASKVDGCDAFNMSRVEFYSILLTQEPSSSWELEGYKSYDLSDEERTQIVAQYEAGEYFGTDLAIGIFPNKAVPSEAESETTRNSESMDLSRSPLAVFAVLALAVVSVGLLLHQHRRSQNGYTPIVIAKKPSTAHLQGKQIDGKDAKHAGSSSGKGGEAKALKTEPTERFAV